MIKKTKQTDKPPLFYKIINNKTEQKKHLKVSSNTFLLDGSEFTASIVIIIIIFYLVT